MDPLIELLDKYKKARSLASDKAAAESLGLSRQSAHRWRNGGGIEDEHVAAMAEAIGEASEIWMIRVRMERAGRSARRGWERAAARITSAAAMIALAIGLTFEPSTANAGAFSREIGQSVYYVNLLRAVRWIGMRLASLRSHAAWSRWHAIPLDI